MSEFKLHRLVKQMMEYFSSIDAQEKYVDILDQNITSLRYSHSNTISQGNIKLLSKRNSDPQEFINIFEELKAHNIEILGPFIQILTEISKDEKLQSLFKQTPQSKYAQKMDIQNKTSETSNIKSEDLTLNQILERIRSEVDNVRGTNLSAQTKDLQALQNNRTATIADEIVEPRWLALRPNLSLDFISPVCKPFHGTLAPIPTCSQENILIQDLISVLQGIDGEYIVSETLKDNFAPRSFNLSKSVDPSLAELVKQMLPLASHYSTVSRFVESHEQLSYGQVNHAVCAAINRLIRDYFLLISQLETHHLRGRMTLHQFWFYIQPTMKSFEMLASIAGTITKAEAKGGRVLSLLHEHTLSCIGDHRNQELCLFLTQEASVPYMEILEKWIYKGVIDDPYQEFLIEDNEVIQREELPVGYSADFWEKRYTIRRDRIPIFLERIADSILRTGKYLNVIRQCGKSLGLPQADRVVYTVKERQYVVAIEKAYVFASKTLLDLIIKEHDLRGRLKSMKSYFLLSQGDFIVQFMDSCENELAKPIDSIVPTRLESLLELALRTSSAAHDPYKDDMRTELLPYDLMFQMFKILSIHTNEEKEYRGSVGPANLSGLETFSFGFEVQWPVSLVLNRKVIACYQMLFRHLFYCKHVERLLCRVWICNKVAKTFPADVARAYRSAFALRQRMLNCVQNLEYYMMVEVIEPNWLSFEQSMSKVQNVDEVLACHTHFLEVCLKDCMLTSPQLLRTVSKLMSVCVQFCNFIQTTELGSSNSLSTSGVDGVSNDSFEQNIAKLDLQFTAVLVGLLAKITELPKEANTEKLVNVLYRLDFNSFYSEQLERFSASDRPIKQNDISG